MDQYGCFNFWNNDQGMLSNRFFELAFWFVESSSLIRLAENDFQFSEPYARFEANFDFFRNSQSKVD